MTLSHFAKSRENLFICFNFRPFPFHVFSEGSKFPVIYLSVKAERGSPWAFNNQPNCFQRNVILNGLFSYVITDRFKDKISPLQDTVDLLIQWWGSFTSDGSPIHISNSPDSGLEYPEHLRSGYFASGSDYRYFLAGKRTFFSREKTNFLASSVFF